MYIELEEQEELEKKVLQFHCLTPHEFRMLQKLKKLLVLKLEGKSVPNISSVKEKKVNDLKLKLNKRC